MKIFRSISIRSRLLLAFGFLQVLIIAITAYATTVINSVGGAPDSVTILIAIAGCSVLITLFTALSFINSIVKPIKFLTDVAMGVGNGDLNIQLHTDDKDELGVFKNSFGKMINTINSLTEDIEYMAVAQSEGVSVIHIDSDKYKGKYNEISVLVNDMITEQSDITQSAINTIFEIAGGNFNAQVRNFPGDKAILNRTIETLRENLYSIHGEISRLAQGAINGDLSNSAEVSKFTGDWSKLMEDINLLLKAFTTPLNDTISVLEHIAVGDFTAKMQGDYKGDYKKIEESVTVMVSNIGGYINEISQTLEAVSSKDFTVGIEREYVGVFNSLKEAINKIIMDFNEIFTNIGYVSKELSIGSKIVSDSSLSLANGVADQTGAINTLLDALKDFEAVSRQSSAEAESASEKSNDANEYALLGVEKMESLLYAMDEIKKSSNAISSITKIIDDIAFQINLLSINASIEAAQAGRYGKGFGVVAQEVRSLANKSRDIADEVAISIATSSEKVSAGAVIVESATETLKAISSRISSASEIISGISSVSKEQTRKVSIVHDNTYKISSMTDNTCDAPHKFAATAEELSSQAEVLDDALRRFKLRKLMA